MVQLPSLINEILAAGGPLTSHKTNDSDVKGFIMTERGPMLIVSRPIVKSTNEGPIRGTLVMGRWLTAASIKELRSRTRASVEIWPIERGAIPPEDRAVLAQLHAESDTVLRDASRGKLLSYGILQDLYGRPLLLMRADIDKSITAGGAMALRLSGWLSIISAVVLAGVLWLVLRSMVVRPLLILGDHMIRVGRNNDLRARLAMGRTDEIGTLANEFDRMVARLRDARSHMLEVAHRAGMAEIATDVLHNVGNAMNTINVATGTLGERLQNSRSVGLDKAAEMLHSHQSDLAGFLTNDPRGQKLPGYLVQLSEAVQQERGDLLDELQALQQKVHHVCDIIMLQQDYANGPSLLMAEDLALLTDGALRMNEQLLEAAGVTIERKYEPLPPILVNRVKFTQVLVNLVKNALEAMRAAPGGEHRLTVRLRRDGDAAIRLEVTDTGDGLGPRTMGRLFQYGFTTRRDGHGIGLHFCANAMKEMGGTIEAHSDGPGLGATFTLRFEVAAREAIT